jgi:phosphatidylinositol alpha-1,6-mannosyltransferase
VDGTDVAAVARAVDELFADPDRARRMGAAGRAWMSSVWTWEHLGTRLAALLAEPAAASVAAVPASPSGVAGSGSLVGLSSTGDHPSRDRA